MLVLGLIILIFTLLSWWLVYLNWHQQRGWRNLWLGLAIVLTVVDLMGLFLIIRLAGGN